jgi:hypothetical protein
MLSCVFCYEVGLMARFGSGLRYDSSKYVITVQIERLREIIRYLLIYK